MADSVLTTSLCPVCLERIPADYETRGDNVFLVKTCPSHGRFETIAWEGPPDFHTWKRPKIPTTPPVLNHEIDRGCPFDCGLCPDHRQRSCTIILEVTQRCNLNCSFCYADSKAVYRPDPGLEAINGWYETAAGAGTDFHIQLSGGEPTLREDLPEIVRLGKTNGFSFIQVNTNGMRLARDDEFVSELKSAGLDSVFLQFDGTTDETYRRIRGRHLLDDKLAAIEACGRHGLGVVLVPVLVPGINTAEIGSLVKLGMALSPVVRAVHFQPACYFGRFPEAPDNTRRITLPRLMRSLEEQTGGLFKTLDFKPPGCENALCSFHANYLLEDGGSVRLLGGGASCCSGEPQPAEEGARRTVSRVGRQWAAPKGKGLAPLPMAPTSHDYSRVQSPPSLDDFLNRARQNTFSVSAMAFQDAWNLDLERLRDCCIHIMSPDDRLIPFCAYNMTGANGRRLYR